MPGPSHCGTSASSRRADELHDLGYDAVFQRTWRFYLAYCEAGFRAGSTDVRQFELVHGDA